MSVSYVRVRVCVCVCVWMSLFLCLAPIASVSRFLPLILDIFVGSCCKDEATGVTGLLVIRRSSMLAAAVVAPSSAKRTN